MKWIPCIQCSSNKANDLLARSSLYMSNKRYSSAAYVNSKGGYGDVAFKSSYLYELFLI